MPSTVIVVMCRTIMRTRSGLSSLVLLLALGCSNPQPQVVTPTCPDKASVAVTPTPEKPAPTPAPELAAPTKLDPAAIDAWLAAELRARDVVGAQLAIYVEGKPVLMRNYGQRSKAGEPVTDDTAFALGSITKQFVCVAASMLHERRKLSLDDRVAKWYPQLTRANDITLDDLGSHLSGYPDFYPLDFVDRRMQQTIELDQLIQLYATGPLDFEPRTRWSYSNTGFIVLGRVIERVTDEPLGAWLQQHVFAPLHMDHAVFEPPRDAAGLAQGHTSFALGEPELSTPEAQGWIHAAGGIHASASDLMRWNLALAEGHEAVGSKAGLLAPKGWRRMTSSRTLVDGRGTDYGCGISVRRTSGETVLAHSGAISGFVAYNAVVPRTRSAVVLLANTEGADVGELHQTLLGLLLMPPASVPIVDGPPAVEVARGLFEQLQTGQLDRTLLSEELSIYYDDARVQEAAPRLAALGSPSSVTADRPRERGGMEVTTVNFTFAEQSVKALLYRSPDGKVQEFLLVRD
jgi:D-alanyl-D-alanine carboxypeptidase